MTLLRTGMGGYDPNYPPIISGGMKALRLPEQCNLDISSLEWMGSDVHVKGGGQFDGSSSIPHIDPIYALEVCME